MKAPASHRFRARFIRGPLLPVVATYMTSVANRRIVVSFRLLDGERAVTVGECDRPIRERCPSG